MLYVWATLVRRICRKDLLKVAQSDHTVWALFFLFKMLYSSWVVSHLDLNIGMLCRALGHEFTLLWQQTLFWTQAQHQHFFIIIFLNGPDTAAFYLFSFFSHNKYSTNLTLIYKSINGVLGTRTRHDRMVRTEEFTEPWRYPLFIILFGLFDLILLLVCHICHVNYETENWKLTIFKCNSLKRTSVKIWGEKKWLLI